MQKILNHNGIDVWLELTAVKRYCVSLNYLVRNGSKYVTSIHEGKKSFMFVITFVLEYHESTSYIGSWKNVKSLGLTLFWVEMKPSKCITWNNMLQKFITKTSHSKVLHFVLQRVTRINMFISSWKKETIQMYSLWTQFFTKFRKEKKPIQMSNH